MNQNQLCRFQLSAFLSPAHPEGSGQSQSS
nr:MAG TPA: hypothetical protein [Caudoviricetes sp.]